jgi:hypothetical protein
MPPAKANLQPATKSGRARLTDWLLFPSAALINAFSPFQFWNWIELRNRAVL